MIGIAVAPFGYDPHEDILKRYHADTTGHSGRTFLEHLKGTRRLLQEWEMPEYVCTAGLFHSIYGTNIFTVASAPLEDREVLQTLIGAKAEWLAYLFCVANRPNAFLSVGETGRLMNRHTYQEIPITNQERLELIAIEVANHIEQDMGAQLIAHIWDKPQHNVLLTKKAMDDMRRFMHRHGINR
jgi:hypothetical protein